MSPRAMSHIFDGGIDKVAATALTEVERGNRFVRSHQHLYKWSRFTDPEQHRLRRHHAAERFATHTRQDPSRYVPGRLPRLPFPDNDFDLVLSSHLLFSYAQDLDYDFHLSALIELMRVAHGELRVFPLVPIGEASRYPRLDNLLADLRTHAIDGRIVDVDYEFQVGGTEMLICRPITDQSAC